jgi:hypothetical protein
VSSYRLGMSYTDQMSALPRTLPAMSRMAKRHMRCPSHNRMAPVCQAMLIAYGAIKFFPCLPRPETNSPSSSWLTCDSRQNTSWILCTQACENCAGNDPTVHEKRTLVVLGRYRFARRTFAPAVHAQSWWLCRTCCFQPIYTLSLATPPIGMTGM